MKKRVLAASIKHETHAFNRIPTTLAHFRAQQYAIGDAIPTKYKGVRLEMGGFLDAAERYGWEQLRIFGIEPTEKSVLVVKCMQGHHAAFDPISSVSLDVDSGGLTTVDIARLPFKKVPRPVWPLDDI